MNKSFSDQVQERGNLLMSHMKMVLDSQKRKPPKSRKIIQKKEVVTLRPNDLKPVSTIIQSLANLSGVTVDDIVKQLAREKVLTAGKTVKKKLPKPNITVKKKSAKRPTPSPKRVIPPAPSTPKKPNLQETDAPKTADKFLGARKDHPAKSLLSQLRTREDKGKVVSNKFPEVGQHKIPATDENQAKVDSGGESGVPVIADGKVLSRPFVKESQSVRSPTSPVNASMQKNPYAEAAVVRNVDIGKEFDAVGLSQLNRPSTATRLGIGGQNTATSAGSNVQPPPTAAESPVPKTMYELKMQLIDRFNKKRLEEKAKAQLNQERLNVATTQVELSNSKAEIQYTGELMNLGIGLKRSEMLEKEYMTVANYVPKKRYLQLKLKAEEALRKEITFAICGRSNGWPSVRRYFMARNWVERFATQDSDDKRLALPGLQQPPDNDAMVLSRLTSRVPVKFVWTEINLNWNQIPANTIVNKFPASIRPVSTKVGLLLHLNNQVWTYNPNYSYVKHPRAASLYDEEDMKQFSALFRVNACVCLLKNFVECMDQEREIVAANGTVPLEAADFAVQRVCELVTYMENADLDIWHSSVVSDDEWALFLLRFQDITHFGAKFKFSMDYNVQKLVTCAKNCLRHVRDFWPDIDVEGVRNLWIVKPSASSCGKGIRIFKTQTEIQNHCKSGYSYLVQKYIERPMQIYKTKFDIRQWFVVSSINPLTIYLYDICYLRFCSREFSLLNLHESIHLSNNSVQCRYTNMTTRSSELPSDNMWDSDTFVNYLRARKEDDKWYAITLPGIRKGITGAFLASQDMMTHRNNSFNLYGADFMLTEDFVPWLIEINNGPCLRPTTSVTSRLCPMVIEDTISLILKTKHTATQGTLPTSPGNFNEVGRFKLIYSQKPQPLPPPRSNLADITITAKKARIHNEKHYQERRRTAMAVPMFKDSSEDSPTGTYEYRSLKYEKIANYKQNPVSIVRTTTVEDTKRAPIPPGGSVTASMMEYRASFQGSHFASVPRIPEDSTSLPKIVNMQLIYFPYNRGRASLSEIHGIEAKNWPTFERDTQPVICIIYGYPVHFMPERSKNVLMIWYCVTSLSITNLLFMWLRFIQNWFFPSPSNVTVLDRMALLSKISSVGLIAIVCANLFHFYSLIVHRSRFSVIFKNGKVFENLEMTHKIVITVGLTGIFWRVISLEVSLSNILFYSVSTVNHLIVLQFCAVINFYSKELVQAKKLFQTHSTFLLIIKYEHITNVVRRANHQFRFQNLVTFSSLFIDIAYMTTFLRLAIAEGSISSSNMVYYVHVAAHRVLLLVYFLGCCNRIKSAADNFNIRLFGQLRKKACSLQNVIPGSKSIMVNSLSLEELRRDILFMTRNRPLNLTACGFFTYGLPLLPTVTASLITYVAILLQSSSSS